MSTTLITANQADSARLTVELMRWNNIHHLPVVDDQRNLVGLITWRHLDKYWEQIRLSENLLCVEDIMVKKVVTVEMAYGDHLKKTPFAMMLRSETLCDIECLISDAKGRPLKPVEIIEKIKFKIQDSSYV